MNIVKEELRNRIGLRNLGLIFFFEYFAKLINKNVYLELLKYIIIYTRIFISRFL